MAAAGVGAAHAGAGPRLGAPAGAAVLRPYARTEAGQPDATLGPQSELPG
jgi:hypothetical protein